MELPEFTIMKTRFTLEIMIPLIKLAPPNRVLVGG